MSEVNEEDTDKKKIYQDERKWFVEWLKTICERPFEEVRILADKLVAEEKVSSHHTLISELCDGDGHKAIHFAVSRNHLDTSKWILDEDPSSIRVIDNNGYSPLDHAVIGNLKEMIDFLLAHGADINQSDCIPALDVAIDKDNVNMVKLLLNGGANVNLSSPKSNGLPIHHACAHNNIEILKLLLHYDVKLNVKDEQGITPLLYAAVNTNPGMIQLLLEHGADPQVSLPQGETALHIVAECGHIPSVKCFVSDSRIHQLANLKDVNGRVPAAYAAESSQIEVLRLLLQFTEDYKNMTVEEILKEFAPKEPSKPVEEVKPVRTLSAVEKEIVRRKDKEASALFREERYQDAAEVFTAALDIDPDNEVLYSNRSSCYLHLNEDAKAMDDAEACIRLKPEWAKGYYRKGMVLFHQERFIDAAEAFYHGCELDPTNTQLANKYKESIQIGKEHYQNHTLKE